MSKNTERGIGLQGEPADGQAGESPASGDDLPKPGEPQRPSGEDSRSITLLGVPSPLADRGKATAPGRDVHLPVEAHRMATSRPIALPGVSPGPVTARGSGVQPPKNTAPEAPKTESAQVGSAGVSTEVALEVRRPDAGKAKPGAPERAEPVVQPTRPTNPADRATFDASPLVVGEESSAETIAMGGIRGWFKPALRPSIGLGIGMALVLSIVLVSIVRFTALDEGDEEPYGEENIVANHPAAFPKETPDQNQKAPPTPAAEPAQAVATGDAAAEAAETDEKLEELPAPARDVTGKDARRAPPRMRPAGTTAKRSPTGDADAVAATGGSGSAASVSPVVPPPKPAAPNQPYDPDSPLPPAGE